TTAGLRPDPCSGRSRLGSFDLRRHGVQERVDLMLQFGDALAEGFDLLPFRIRELPVLELPIRDGAHANNAAGNADDGGMIRNRMHYDRAGADLHVIANPNAAEHLGAAPDHHVVADGRVALAALVARTAESDALKNQNIVANFS